MVDGAEVTQTDIRCQNGVIHMVDKVMMPPSEEKAKTSGD
jgi:uncharacterized surface protein with fasciclin (FAS1) repeats